jgi:hypothetical protein
VCQSWSKGVAIEEAIANNDYFKTYYLEDDTVGRVDYYDKEDGLFKVSYHELQPPYDDILDEHCAKYPGVRCEFVTPAIVRSDGQRVVWTRLYHPGKALKRQDEIYLDYSR